MIINVIAYLATVHLHINTPGQKKTSELTTPGCQRALAPGRKAAQGYRAFIDVITSALTSAGHPWSFLLTNGLGEHQLPTHWYFTEGLDRFCQVLAPTNATFSSGGMIHNARGLEVWFSETLPLHWVMHGPNSRCFRRSTYPSMDNEVFIDLNINQSLQGQSAQAQSVRFLPVAPNGRL